MKFYYIYILECSDSLLYIGITNDLERRLLEHKRGLNKNCFTYKRRPLRLIFNQEFNDVIQAITFEKKIKKWSAKIITHNLMCHTPNKNRFIITQRE